MKAILQRRRGRTPLLFGQRLGALDQATRIVVLAEGQIVEAGTLPELVALDGEFVRLFDAQLARRRQPALLPPPLACHSVA